MNRDEKNARYQTLSCLHERLKMITKIQGPGSDEVKALLLQIEHEVTALGPDWARGYAIWRERAQAA